VPAWAFLTEVVLVSLSGVMAPGPLSAATVARGSESSHAGALVAVGHGIVEIPLMVAVLYGLGHLLERSQVRVGVALVGGVLLAVMGVGMLRGIRQAGISPSESPRPPLTEGILLTLANPYFLLWWATVGATLVWRSVELGMVWFLAMALVHWLCDLAWLYLLSALSFRGGRFLGRRFQAVVVAVSGALLLLFSARFIVGAVRELLA